MRNKKIVPQIMAATMCVSMVLGNSAPVFAVDGESSSSYDNLLGDTMSTKNTEVLYGQNAAFTVTVPKVIVLGSDRQGIYSVKVEGDIPSDKQVYVSPIDEINNTEKFDFYMYDQSKINPKADVGATVAQNKFYWDFKEVADGYEETNNSIVAEGLSSGTWKGTFNFEISMKAIGEQSETDRAYLDWNYTLDDESKTITLNYYTGDDVNAVVQGSYKINGIDYSTKIASNDENAFSNYMFAGNATLETITFEEGIDTANVISMANMFCGCESLTNIEGLTNLNTEKVTNMYSMFGYCDSLENIDVSSFDTTNVTDMRYMFCYCKSLTALDLSTFNTANVTKMSNMFNHCETLAGLDLSSFNTSKVTDMNAMFSECHSLTSLNVSSFDTSKVTDMMDMFLNDSSIARLDLRSFNTNQVFNMNSMFYGCSKLKTIYATKNKWVVLSYCLKTDMFKNCGTSSVTYK